MDRTKPKTTNKPTPRLDKSQDWERATALALAEADNDNPLIRQANKDFEEEKWYESLN